MRPILIRIALAATAGGAAWLFGGRLITLFVDRFVTVRVAAMPASPLTYCGGTFQIGEQSFGIQTAHYQPLDVRVEADSQGRFVLSSGGKSFVLGPGTIQPDTAGCSRYECAPEPGDQVSLTRERSAASWPTPFEFNFITGRTPSWKRHLYYRFVWKKPSGARLRMSWRYEQWHYPSNGWTESAMTSVHSNGQIQLDIHP